MSGQPNRPTRFHVALSPNDLAAPRTTKSPPLDTAYNARTGDHDPILDATAWAWQVYLGSTDVVTYLTASQAFEISQAWAEIAADIASTVHALSEPPAALAALTARCRECDRVFDLSDDIDAGEWLHGHDCEA
jgi:hypothetical protein